MKIYMYVGIQSTPPKRTAMIPPMVTTTVGSGRPARFCFSSGSAMRLSSHVVSRRFCVCGVGGEGC